MEGAVTPPPGFEMAFPTRWIWEEDFEEDMKKTIKEYEESEIERKEKLKNKLITRQEKRELLKGSIRSKLTSEELKGIRFK